MSDRNSSIGGSGRGLVQAPISRPTSRTSLPDPSARIPDATQRRAPQRDPYNLRAAFDRLKKLLLRDTDGQPQQGLPRRGYYLNILV